MYILYSASATFKTPKRAQIPQFFDEEGKWLIPPLFTLKNPMIQELENDQKEALSRGDQLLEAIKKEFKKY